jgi:hypothetical protein
MIFDGTAAPAPATPQMDSLRIGFQVSAQPPAKKTAGLIEQET